MSSQSIDTLITQIRSMAAAQPDPERFVQLLQAEIERIPGAHVAFATRDFSWLQGYLEERGDVSKDDQQAALVAASLKYDESYASMDAITYTMDAYLDEHHPLKQEGNEP